MNQLDEDEFEMFYRYHLATCERADLLMAMWLIHLIY